MYLRRLATTLLGATLLISGAGCSAPQVIRDNEVTLMVGTAESRADALISGTLAITESGCMGIAPEGGGAAIPAVWPPGTKLVLEGQGVEYNDRVIEIGEIVTGGGGEEPSAGFDPPEECSSDLYAVLWELQ